MLKLSVIIAAAVLTRGTDYRRFASVIIWTVVVVIIIYGVISII